MKRYSSLLMFLLMVCGLNTSLWAADNLAELVAKGCEKDIESLCNNVTEGDGRILACLYAYSDKLSSQCEYMLYDSAILLQRIIGKLVYLTSECDDDVKKYCSSVTLGEGRLLVCLDENADKISQRCSVALKDIRNK